MSRCRAAWNGCGRGVPPKSSLFSMRSYYGSCDRNLLNVGGGPVGTGPGGSVMRFGMTGILFVLLLCGNVSAQQEHRSKNAPSTYGDCVDVLELSDGSKLPVVLSEPSGDMVRSRVRATVLAELNPRLFRDTRQRLVAKLEKEQKKCLARIKEFAAERQEKIDTILKEYPELPKWRAIAQRLSKGEHLAVRYKSDPGATIGNSTADTYIVFQNGKLFIPIKPDQYSYIDGTLVIAGASIRRSRLEALVVAERKYVAMHMPSEREHAKWRDIITLQARIHGLGTPKPDQLLELSVLASAVKTTLLAKHGKTPYIRAVRANIPGAEAMEASQLEEALERAETARNEERKRWLRTLREESITYGQIKSRLQAEGWGEVSGCPMLDAEEDRTGQASVIFVHPTRGHGRNWIEFGAATSIKPQQGVVGLSNRVPDAELREICRIAGWSTNRSPK